jgi:hypothetical protein
MPITEKTLPILIWIALLVSCGVQKDSSVEIPAQARITLHPSFSMPLPGELTLSKIALRRVDCEYQDDSTEHILQILRDEETFIFNVPQAEVGDCGLLVRRVVLVRGSNEIEFELNEHARTQQGAREITLSQIDGSAGITVTLPERTEPVVARDTNWPINFAYIEDYEGLFPRVASNINNSQKNYNYKLAFVEDRGVVGGGWKEFGVTISCDGWSSFLNCAGESLKRMNARLVKIGDVDVKNYQDVTAALAQTELRFQSTITHFVGTGLRFTINHPLDWQNEDLYLIVGRNEGYNVFRINQDLVSAANQ